MLMTEILIDAKYLKGPMPVLRAARSLRGLEPGAKLRVLATDPGAVADFRDFCRDNGHALLSWSEMKGVFSFTIRCGAEKDGKAAQAGPARAADAKQKA
jgi:tRNA 2-thiouridine synthesizing protein A